MVQICSECNEKHINSAETMTDKSSDTVKSLNFGNGGSRFSPSDSKSQANSDSSYVRFKVYLNKIETIEDFALIFVFASLQTAI